jgi:hypothetical protein
VDVFIVMQRGLRNSTKIPPFPVGVLQMGTPVPG